MTTVTTQKVPATLQSLQTTTAGGLPIRPPSLRVAIPKRRRDSKRDALLKAAREEIAANGFAGTHVNVVAARVGIRKSTFFHYFADKEALHEAAVGQLLDEVADAIDAVAASTTTFGARIDELVECFHRHLMVEPILARLILRCIVDAPAISSQRPSPIDRVLTHIAEAIALGVVEARVPATDASHTALSIVCVLCTGHLTTSLPVIPHGEGPMGGTDLQQVAELRARVRRLLAVR